MATALFFVSAFSVVGWLCCLWLVLRLDDVSEELLVLKTEKRVREEISQEVDRRN